MSFSCMKINGTSYHVKDATARTDIASLKARVQTLENNAGSGGSSSKTVTTLWSGSINNAGTINLSQSMLNFDLLIFVCYECNMTNTSELNPSVSIPIPVDIFALNEEVYNDIDCDTCLLWEGKNQSLGYDPSNLTNTSIYIKGNGTNHPTIVKVVGVKY